MDKSTYAQYIALVNAGSIRQAADQFFAPNFTIFKNKREYTDLESFMRTKELQHRYMHESIDLLGFYPGEKGFVVEVMYGWHADKDVDRDAFDKAGCAEGCLALKAGESSTAHCVFIYETEGSKFRRVRVYDLED